jgi:hypothetical protein
MNPPNSIRKFDSISSGERQFPMVIPDIHEIGNWTDTEQKAEIGKGG